MRGRDGRGPSSDYEVQSTKGVMQKCTEQKEEFKIRGDGATGSSQTVGHCTRMVGVLSAVDF